MTTLRREGPNAVGHFTVLAPPYNRTMSDVAQRALLGGLTASSFLRFYWHKRALLVRHAIAGFRGLLDASELFALAARDDVESRLIVREGSRWSVAAGPFRRSHLASTPERNWTLLVHGVNLHVAAADALLRRFAFLSYVRLDDVMVSYAAPGGGVGPHVDSYDVFLLQGGGRRRWRIGAQRDVSLKPSLPLKILARFEPDKQHILEAGDMLYLPPAYAHDGVAIDACTTCSIGFRAPEAQELIVAFLDWLRDRIAAEGRDADPKPGSPREPARIEAAMQDRCAAILARIRWDRATVARFLGCYLTEPKPHVYFHPPRRPLPRKAFAAEAARRGLHLDLRSQLLYDNRNAYLNGEVFAWPRGGAAMVRQLANERRIDGADAKRVASAASVYSWYCDGFIHLA